MNTQLGGLPVYKEYHYYCTKCKKNLSQDTLLETEFVEVKGRWCVKYMTNCSCGGEISAGFPTEYFGSVGEVVVENVVMGCNPNQIPEMMRTHPGSEYDARGRLITKGFHAQERAARQRGMVID